jgi:hypothetical protein
MAGTTITITGVISDADGASATFSTSAAIDSVSIVSAAVVPQTAPAGTLRTLTVVAASSAGAALTFSTPVATGITFTAIAGQPAGQAQWTFTF